jgi:hypothetical protein
VEDSKIVLPALGALLAAIIGGGIWALITVLTNYELGIIAWGLGALAGYVVVYLARRQTTQVHQILAVIGSLLGIVLGKYFTFTYTLQDDLAHIFDNQAFTFFQQNFTEFFGGMDIVFVLLAVITAWRMPSRMSDKVEQPVAAE